MPYSLIILIKCFCYFSPDLLERCQVVLSDGEFVKDSPTNLTDIIISDDDGGDDDDDKKSFNSDATIVLEYDYLYLYKIFCVNPNFSIIK